MSESLKYHLFCSSNSALKYYIHSKASKTHAACTHSSKHIWELAQIHTHTHTPLDICLCLRWWYTTYGAQEPFNPPCREHRGIHRITVWVVHTVRFFRLGSFFGKGWQANGSLKKFDYLLLGHRLQVWWLNNAVGHCWIVNKGAVPELRTLSQLMSS